MCRDREVGMSKVSSGPVRDGPSPASATVRVPAWWPAGSGQHVAVPVTLDDVREQARVA